MPTAKREVILPNPESAHNANFLSSLGHIVQSIRFFTNTRLNFFGTHEPRKRLIVLRKGNIVIHTYNNGRVMSYREKVLGDGVTKLIPIPDSERSALGSPRPTNSDPSSSSTRPFTNEDVEDF